MPLKFLAYGHENITATHPTTIEITKDSELSLRGDCIIGVKANFNKKELLDFIKNKKKLVIKIRVDNLEEIIECKPNPNFNDSHEIVIRKSKYLSQRTLGINSNRAASDLSNEIVKKLKNPNKVIEIIIED